MVCGLCQPSLPWAAQLGLQSHREQSQLCENSNRGLGWQAVSRNVRSSVSCLRWVVKKFWVCFLSWWGREEAKKKSILMTRRLTPRIQQTQGWSTFKITWLCALTTEHKTSGWTRAWHITTWIIFLSKSKTLDQLLLDLQMMRGNQNDSRAELGKPSPICKPQERGDKYKLCKLSPYFFPETMEKSYLQLKETMHSQNWCLCKADLHHCYSTARGSSSLNMPALCRHNGKAQTYPMHSNLFPKSSVQKILIFYAQFQILSTQSFIHSKQ